MAKTDCSHSMSRWIAESNALTPEFSGFTAALSREETAKTKRLQSLADESGLPVYDTACFTLPKDLSQYRNACASLTSSGVWQLAIRLAQPNGVVVYRKLGAGLVEALHVAQRFSAGGSILATVTPYRRPERSGTLWVGNEGLLLELVFGPHYWITKWPPRTRNVLRCTYFPTALPMRYSVGDTGTKQLLYETACRVTRFTLGCEIRDIGYCGTGVYAEFHWHRTVGYRFIECSFSAAWTAVHQTAVT